MKSKTSFGKLLILLFLLLTGCQGSDYPGYTRLKRSIHYKLVALGDEGKPLDSGAYVSFRVAVRSWNDSAIAIKSFNRVEVKELTVPAPLLHLLREAHQDDSLAVIGTAADLRLADLFTPSMFPDDTAVVRLTLNVSEVLSQDEFRIHRANERLLLDREMAEQQALAGIRDSLGLNEDNYIDGMYYLSLKEGTGKRPVSGANLVVHYQAHFHDGTLFDDTYAGELLEYEVGRPDQVIAGFASGIAQMREGGEAVFVIPSAAGFGHRGSSSGIVPPFTTLIYRVKLIRVSI